MIGGQRFLVSPLTSFEIVRASVSSRCTRLSASASGARAASSFARAATWAASLSCEAPQPVAVGADAALKRVALGGEVGERGGQLGEQPLGGGERRLGLGNALV